MAAFRIPAPELQIDFSFALGQMRTLYMQDALGSTVEKTDLALLNTQLSEYVPEH
ncbi:type II site-specific deoxyribonuclease [Methylocaldum marinum]|uniref:Type II site-specific deoxyribonuclease n=2 Tax=Methylocaldum TaxID=73778 RepID=A0A250KPZ7_9GAMM|nr:hypothetical protein [Methylocaldum marinum]BBA33624.1 type II site-specific deoxyribonuclease [Methylocaldum marinum]